VFFLESILQSPFEQFCDDMDSKMIATGISERTQYWSYVQKHVSTEYLTSLLIADWNFRKKFRMNVLASFEGQQGRAFKSLMALYAGILLGKIYGVPFEIEKNITTDPFDLEKRLKESPNRSTFLYDEVKKTQAGLMSKTNYFRLLDYEEQGRFNQPNILYATPHLWENEHYFQFKEFSNERLKNSFCSKCPFSKECYELDQTKTLCSEKKEVQQKLKLKKPIFFWQREGYPIKISFLLETRRKFDNMLVPRGVVTFPIVHHEVLVKYEELKKRSMDALKKDDSSMWRNLTGFVDDFVNRNFDLLVRTTKDGREVPIASNEIEIFLYDEITPNKYTTAVNKLLVTMIRSKVKKQIFGNEEKT